MSNGKVTTEGALALTEVQDKTLTAVLNLIIPPSDDGRMPGATECDILGYIQDAARDLIPTLAEELDQLEGVAQAQAGTPFTSLDEAAALGLITQIRASQLRFMGKLAEHTVSCYYQQDRVLLRIGMEARAPYPKGYDVEAGDLSLLDPVRARGQVYRDVGDD